LATPIFKSYDEFYIFNPLLTLGGVWTLLHFFTLDYRIGKEPHYGDMRLEGEHLCSNFSTLAAKIPLGGFLYFLCCILMQACLGLIHTRAKGRDHGIVRALDSRRKNVLTA
jgi:hypothetical protein